MTKTLRVRSARSLTQACAMLLFALAGAVQAAEPFRLQTPAGDTVEFTGKSQPPATILLFWATWCPYCKALMPHLQSVIDQYGDDVRLLAISVKEDGDPAAFMKEAGYDWTLLMNGDDADNDLVAALTGSPSAGERHIRERITQRLALRAAA